jgi:hypothetical protein
VGNALQPPFRKAIVGVVASDPRTSARRMRFLAKVFIAIGGVFVAIGIVSCVSERRITFFSAYPIVIGCMTALNGFTLLRNARSFETGQGSSLWRSRGSAR